MNNLDTLARALRAATKGRGGSYGLDPLYCALIIRVGNLAAVTVDIPKDDDDVHVALHGLLRALVIHEKHESEIRIAGAVDALQQTGEEEDEHIRPEDWSRSRTGLCH